MVHLRHFPVWICYKQQLSVWSCLTSLTWAASISNISSAPSWFPLTCRRSKDAETWRHFIWFRSHPRVHIKYYITKHDHTNLETPLRAQKAHRKLRQISVPFQNKSFPPHSETWIFKIQRGQRFLATTHAFFFFFSN